MIGLYSANSQSGVGFTGLLDDYPDAAAAYSVRRLSSTYSGALIEVRRSSDNTVQDIGYDSDGDLDTAALLSFVGAGDGFVRTWYDQSGNNKNLTQTTTSNQPILVNSGTLEQQNTLPAVRFVSNDYLESSLTSQFNFLHDGTESLISSVFNTSLTSGIMGSAGGSGSDIGYSQRVRASTSFQSLIANGTSFIVNNIIGAVTANQLIIFQDEIDANNATVSDRSKIYLDDSAAYQSNSSTGTASSSDASYTFKIGAWGNLSLYMSGYFSEAVFWDSDQSSNREDIRDNQNTYYSIY